METVIERIILAFNGHCYAVAGVVMGFFDDPAQTQECALRIANLTHHEVEVFGNQLTLVL
ncbi:hypothetical protein ACWJKU_18550 [Methylocaldum sp. MU1018]|jgi:hypothetical protein